MEILIAKTTKAATKEIDGYRTNVNSIFPYVLGAVGTLGAGEEIKIEFSDGEGGWQTAKIDGAEVKLDLNTNITTVYGPMIFRVNKTVTVAEVSVVGG